MTNPAAMDMTPLPKETTRLVVGYKRVHDRAAGTTRTYRTEARRAGKVVTLVVTDLASGEVVPEQRLPNDDDDGTPPPPRDCDLFPSVQACLHDFICANKSRFECEANKSCATLYPGVTCCAKVNGVCQCVSTHLMIRPTSLICQMLDGVVDFEGLGFTQE